MKFCITHPDKKSYAKNKCKSCYFIDYLEKKRTERKEKGYIASERPASAYNQRYFLKIIYSTLCAELKPLHPICEGQLPGCTITATQIHHKKSRHGIMLIMSVYFGYLCDNCHKRCTKHSREAKELGLSLPINSQTDYIFTPREIELINKYKIRTPKGVYIT